MPRIMIIDDDPDFVEALTICLEGAGYEVVNLDETRGAVERIREIEPDGLVLDVIFPEDSSAGFDLAREIRETEDLAHLPILLLTAVNIRFPLGFGPHDIDETWLPVQDFLEKPVDFDLLIERMKRLVPLH